MKNNEEISYLEELPDLRKKLLLEIEQALKRGGKADFFAATERLRAGDALLEQAVSLWRNDQGPLTTPAQSNLDGPFGNYISEKARGEYVRSEWVNKNLKKSLTRIKGTLYRNTRGEIVGIAYAKETEKRKGRWFSGLQENKFKPDQRFENVILICQSINDRLDAVCLPRDFISKYREKLSRSHGQIKFHGYKK